MQDTTSTTWKRPPVHWLHVKWSELDVELSARSTDGHTIVRTPLGHLSGSLPPGVSATLRGASAVVLELPAFPFQALVWPHRNPLRNLLHTPVVAHFAQVYWRLLRFIRSTGKPLYIFDLQDSTGISRRFLPFLQRAEIYFKRELPRFPANTFLHTEVFSIEPWRNRGRYAAGLKKIRPLSIAAGLFEIPQAPPVSKDIDVFWSGSIENSPARERGVRLLEQLRDEGVRVTILDKRVDKQTFLSYIARSWLTFSPDGNGWQCWRTFEAAFLKSVPLMSYPTVWQDVPFTHGENCLYYDPEGKDLKNVILRALAYPENLLRLANNAHHFVQAHHHQAAVYYRHLGPSKASSAVTDATPTGESKSGVLLQS